MGPAQSHTEISIVWGPSSQSTALIVLVDREAVGSAHQAAVDAPTKCSEPPMLGMPWHSHCSC